jgi:hypothetical protein
MNKNVIVAAGALGMLGAGLVGGLVATNMDGTEVSPQSDISNETPATVVTTPTEATTTTPTSTTYVYTSDDTMVTGKPQTFVTPVRYTWEIVEPSHKNEWTVQVYQDDGSGWRNAPTLIQETLVTPRTSNAHSGMLPPGTYNVIVMCGRCDLPTTVELNWTVEPIAGLLG